MSPADHGKGPRRFCRDADTHHARAELDVRIEARGRRDRCPEGGRAPADAILQNASTPGATGAGWPPTLPSAGPPADAAGHQRAGTARRNVDLSATSCASRTQPGRNAPASTRAAGRGIELDLPNVDSAGRHRNMHRPTTGRPAGRPQRGQDAHGWNAIERAISETWDAGLQVAGTERRTGLT